MELFCAHIYDASFVERIFLLPILRKNKGSEGVYYINQYPVTIINNKRPRKMMPTRM